jgi:hypothetical protein
MAASQGNVLPFKSMSKLYGKYSFSSPCARLR